MAVAGVTVAVIFSLDIPLMFKLTADLSTDTSVTAWVTATATVAVLLPSAVVAVMVAVPAPTAVMTAVLNKLKLSLLTRATFILLDLQVTALFDAVTGMSVAEMTAVDVPPIIKLIVELSTDRPLTATSTVAVLLPSAVVTVMVAVPLLTAVMTPLVLTVATAVLLELHVTFLFVAVAGATVATIDAVDVSSMDKLTADLSTDTPLTGVVTVTATVAVLLPSAVVTVMVAVPLPTAVMSPLLLTVATAVLLELQVTALFVAVAGATVAAMVAVDVPPIIKLTEV